MRGAGEDVEEVARCQVPSGQPVIWGGTGLQRQFLTFVKALASHIRNTLPPSDAAELDVTVIFSQRLPHTVLPLMSDRAGPSLTDRRLVDEQIDSDAKS